MYFSLIFFFTATPPTEIYTLSLHDALPISSASVSRPSASVLPISIVVPFIARSTSPGRMAEPEGMFSRSEEHTSELQSRQYLVCRLLLEKKKTKCTGSETEH